MKALFLSFATILLCASLAHAQGVVIQVQKNGKQVIMEIEPIKPPPPVEGKLDVPVPSATAMVMKANDWKCGRFFTDDKGKRWSIIAGHPLDHHPKELSGWRLVTVDGQVNFYTITGRLFRQQP